MSSTLNPEIPNKERLYRSIFFDWWNFKRGEVSIAAFLDARGVSVDRTGDRIHNDIIENLKLRFRRSRLKAISSLTAGKCRKLDTFVFYSRSNRNLYHSSIWNSETEVELTYNKAYNLSKAVRIDFIDDQLI